MLARVKTAFMGKPDTESLSRRVAPGETITGSLAEVAVLAGNAELVTDEAPTANAAKPARKAKAK